MNGETSTLRCAKVFSLVGAFVLSLPDGALWSWGNMSVYMLSYVRMRGVAGRATDSPWLLSFFFVAWTVGVPVAGVISKVLGRRVTLLIGVLAQDGGYFLSYFTIQHSLVGLYITHGAMTGFGCGVTYAIVFLYIVDWVGNNKGLVVSIVTSATTLGGALNIQVTSRLANPDNEAPNLKLGPIKYFTQSKVIANVPQVYLVLGTMCAVLHSIGLALVRNKPKTAINDTVDTAYGLDEQNERTKLQKQVQSALISEYNTSGEASIENGILDEVEGNKDKSINRYQPQLYKATCRYSTDQMRIAKTEIQTPPEQTKCPPKVDEKETRTPPHNEPISYTPGQTLRHRNFYILFLTLLSCDLGLLVFSNYYKTFGALFIADDHELADMGTAITVAVAVSRVVWGVMIDRLGIKCVLVTCSSAFSVLFSFFYFTPMVTPWCYYMWSVTFACVNSSLLSNFSMATLHYFGPKHLAFNVGLVMSCSLFLNLGAPPLIGFLLNGLGWFLLFFTNAVLNLCGLLMVVLGLPK